MRLVLALFGTVCVVPISLSGFAFLAGVARSAADDAVAVVPLSLGVAGLLAAAALLITLLWDRSRIAGDSIRSSLFRTVNLGLMVLGTAIMIGGGLGIFVAVFGLRGALDALFAAFALVLTGVIGLISGAVMATVSNQASSG